MLPEKSTAAPFVQKFFHAMALLLFVDEKDGTEDAFSSSGYRIFAPEETPNLCSSDALLIGAGANLS